LNINPPSAAEWPTAERSVAEDSTFRVEGNCSGLWPIWAKFEYRPTLL
jgi:hypothetical protein